MKSEIIQRYKNPFLNREELLMEITSDVSPSFEEIKKALGMDEKLVVIRKVHSNFGKKRFIAEIMVYESEERKNFVEVTPRKIRKKMEEERKLKLAEEIKKRKEEKSVQASPVSENKGE